MWIRNFGQFSLEFEDHESLTWVFVRTWDDNTFRRVLVDVFGRYLGDCLPELTVLGRVLSCVGDSATVVSLSGGSDSLVEVYEDYLGSGRVQGIIDYPVFDLAALKRCVQRSSSVVFGTLDPFAMTEFLIVRLKGSEHRDWMVSRPALRRAIETGHLEMPSLLDVVANLAGVWPLVVAFIKETAKVDPGDSFVV